jgi:transcriptional regulator with XRE-family HTH domain
MHTLVATTVDSIGIRFKRARMAAEMTQGEVAKHFGVDRGTVYRWECGVSRIDLRVLIDAAGLFGCTREWLTFGDGEPPRVRSVWDDPSEDEPAGDAQPPGEHVEDDEPHEGAA